MSETLATVLTGWELSSRCSPQWQSFPACAEIREVESSLRKEIQWRRTPPIEISELRTDMQAGDELYVAQCAETNPYAPRSANPAPKHRMQMTLRQEISELTRRYESRACSK